MEVVGHSAGCYISGHYAVAYPAHVSKLTLMAPAGFEDPPEGDSAAHGWLYWNIFWRFGMSYPWIVRVSGVLGRTLESSKMEADSHFGPGVRTGPYSYRNCIQPGSSEFGVEYLATPHASGGPGLASPFLHQVPSLKIPTVLVFAEKDETLGIPRSGYEVAAATLALSRDDTGAQFKDSCVVILKEAGLGLVFTHADLLANMLNTGLYPEHAFLPVRPGGTVPLLLR